VNLLVQVQPSVLAHPIPWRPAP